VHYDLLAAHVQAGHLLGVVRVVTSREAAQRPKVELVVSGIAPHHPEGLVVVGERKHFPSLSVDALGPTSTDKQCRATAHRLLRPPGGRSPHGNDHTSDDAEHQPGVSKQVRQGEGKHDGYAEADRKQDNNCHHGERRVQGCISLCRNICRLRSAAK
jgi:hypothetical protein